MKFENVRSLADGELLAAIDQLVADILSQTEAAKKIEVPQSHLSAVRNGAVGAGTKIVEYFGLEERRVLVKKKPEGQGQR